MNIVIDKEVDLITDDLLNTKVYADTLKELIENSPANEPLTIGLFGSWGAGKSSIINTLFKELSPEQPQPKGSDKAVKIKQETAAPGVALVMYDAWKYVNDSFRRTFLLTLQDSLKVKSSPEMKNFYQSSSSENGIEYNTNNPFLLLVFFVLIAALVKYLVDPAALGTWTVAALVAFLSYTTVVFSKTFIELKRAVQTPIMSAPELFEKCFNDLIDQSMSAPKKVSRFKFWAEKNSSGPRYNKIVIVIDNIDRCSKDSAYELLTNTKNFINSKSQVIFLIPMDEEALKKHLFKADPTSVDQGEEFLRKYFNVVVRMKAFRNTEIFDFANRINEDRKIDLKRDTVNIIAREYAKNPRRIIQFYNNLGAELKMMTLKHGAKFVKTYEAAICKFLIIREEWPEQYKKICASPKAFLELDPGNHFLMEEGETSLIISAESYEAFLDSTFVSTRNLKTEDLQKILLNSNNYENFPDSIAKACANGDIKLMKKTIADEGFAKEKVLDHLLFSLKFAIEKELYDTDVSDLMDQLMGFLIPQQGTDKTFIERLESITKRKLGKIIPSSKSYNRLVNFNQLALKKKNLDFLDKGIAEYFHGFKPIDKKEYQDSDFELYHNYLLVADDAQCKNAAGFFVAFLLHKKWNERILSDLKPSQFDILYDLDVLSGVFLDSEAPVWLDNNYDHWLVLLDKLLNLNVFVNLLLDNAGRSIEGFPGNTDHFISKYNELLKKIPSSFNDEKSIEKLLNINDEIFKYDGKRKSSFLISMSDEVKSEVFEYLLESFRFTKGSKSSAGWIDEFIKRATLPRYAKYLANYIKKYKDELDFTNLKGAATSAQHIDEDIHVLQMELLYLTKDGKEVFTDTEIMGVLDELSGNLNEYEEYEGYLKEHLRKARAKNMLKAKMEKLTADELELQPRILREL